jgi:hypothetical protein
VGSIGLSVLFEVQFSRWKWDIGKVVIKGSKSSVGLGEIVLAPLLLALNQKKTGGRVTSSLCFQPSFQR